MPLSKNINTYIDVVEILTAARERGGVVTYELRSKGAALNWRMRAYYYRTLLTRAAIRRAGDVKGFVPTTNWDDMLLEVEGNKVKISFGRIAGKLTDDKGKEIVPKFLPKEAGAAEEMLASQPLTIKQENADLLEAASSLLKGGNKK